eukprot:6385336-Prymnesium_polylepis.1
MQDTQSCPRLLVRRTCQPGYANGQWTTGPASAASAMYGYGGGGTPRRLVKRVGEMAQHRDRHLLVMRCAAQG